LGTAAGVTGSNGALIIDRATDARTDGAGAGDIRAPSSLASVAPPSAAATWLEHGDRWRWRLGPTTGLEAPRVGLRRAAVVDATLRRAPTPAHGRTDPPALAAPGAPATDRTIHRPGVAAGHADTETSAAATDRTTPRTSIAAEAHGAGSTNRRTGAMTVADAGRPGRATSRARLLAGTAPLAVRPPQVTVARSLHRAADPVTSSDPDAMWRDPAAGARPPRPGPGSGPTSSRIARHATPSTVPPPGRDPSPDAARIAPRSAGETDRAQMWGWRPALTGTAAAMIVARALAVRPPTGRDVARHAGRAPHGTPDGADAATSVDRTPADVFAAELRRHAPERPRPIPIVFRPMVTAIVGERPVHVSTGRASRRALARVGKRAATTGATIHLASPSPTAEVIAHELTHVAHPSPHPRFFDDADRGPEERQAEQVAALMRRSRPVSRPSVATGITAAAAATTIRRNPTTTTASSLWDSITSGAGQLYDNVFGGTAQGPATTTAPTDPQPAPAQTAALQQAAAAAVQEPAAPAMDLDDQFERLLERLEDRIISELERRGGRFRGGF
jgi:hypothetical protein